MNQNQNGFETANNLKKTQIHFFYVTLILISAIVIIATKNWTKLQGFTDYLNVAATITSLVLGILAIIYSFVSNGSQSQFLGSIEASSANIASIGAELKSIVSDAQKIQNAGQQRNEEMHELITSLRNAVDGLSNKTSEIANTVESLPTKFSEINDALNKNISPQAGDPTPISWDKQKIEEFLGSWSPLSLCGLKALAIAHATDAYINLSKLFHSNNGFNDYEYILGYLLCADASGLLSLKHKDGSGFEEGICRVEAPSAELIACIDNEWAKRISETGDEKNDLYKEMSQNFDQHLVKE